MIISSRSKFKKKTENYVKDSVFDIIDIAESLKKNRNIRKTDECSFIYNNSIENFKTEKKNVDNNDEAIIKIINSNKFGIKIEELTIEYDNGYETLLINQYSPTGLLGEGSFSFVISAWDINHKINVAIKIIPNKDKFKSDLKECLEKEISIQANLDHKNIIKLYKVQNNVYCTYLIMELMEGGSLKDIILERYLNDNKLLFIDEECSMIIKGILEGIHYMHSRNIMHRDIKPGKITNN